MRHIDCTTYRKLSFPAAAMRVAKTCAALAAYMFLIAALSGCGSIKPVKYYQLTHPPTAALAASPPPVDAALLVRPFQTTHLYREDRIVYGGEGEQLGLYENHRWTQPPLELLPDAFAPAIRTSRHFTARTPLPSD